MTTISDLQSALVALHQARVVAAGYNDQVRIVREAWEAEHKALLDGQRTAKEVLAASDDYARELGLAAFKETGDKRPTLGVEVKDKTLVRYDREKALGWAMEHRIALSLNVNAFEAIVKAGGGIPGVAELVKEPQATLATDLSKAVAALSEVEGLGEKEVTP